MQLYVIATPIGNLDDVSCRTIETLKNVDLVLCEDTRVTKKLLARFEISKNTISYHQHSKIKKLEYILEQIKQGKILALVSDAGTPCISDPGAKLIDYLIKNIPDIKIIPIPGPSALISALSVSGFSADRFVFLGFPPNKKKRDKFFENVYKQKMTVIFYESIHRIKKTLEELRNKLKNERRIIICRELTKKFETIYRGDIDKIIEEINLLSKKEFRGEFVVVVEGK